MYSMALLGVGALLGTMVTGQIYDYYGKNKALTIILVLLGFATLAGLKFMSSQSYSGFTLAFIILWGTMDSSLQTQTYSQLFK